MKELQELVEIKELSEQIQKNVEILIELSTIYYQHHYETEDFLIDHDQLTTVEEDIINKEIVKGEGIVDRLLEREKRNEIIMTTSETLLSEIKQFETIIMNITKQRQDDEITLITRRHQLLDTLEQLLTIKKQSFHQRIMKQCPNEKEREERIKQHEEECQDLIDSWYEYRNETKETIVLRREQILQDHNQIKQVEEWTQSTIGTIVFDSKKDDWTSRETMIERIVNRNKLLFLIEDQRKELFGCYLQTSIPHEFDKWISDEHSFLFNLHSNGRLPTPMKFEIKQIHRAFFLHNTFNSELLFIGPYGSICVFTRDSGEPSTCEQLESAYDYHGFENAICGDEEFIPQRIVVIQMK